MATCPSGLHLDCMTQTAGNGERRGSGCGSHWCNVYWLLEGCVVGEVVIGGKGESGVEVRLGDEGVGIKGIRLEREGGRVAVQSCWIMVERIRRRCERVMEDGERRALLH